MRVRYGVLAPHLQKVLDAATAEPHQQPQQPQPLQPPTTVPNCVNCRKPEKLPVEGSTFRLKKYRGKFRTIGRNGNKRFGRSAEFDSDRSQDYTDDALLSRDYHGSRYGADREAANKESEMREWKRDPKRVEDANKILDDMSARQIEKKYDVPKSSAKRGKDALAKLKPK